jgi:hypothetical protein
MAPERPDTSRILITAAVIVVVGCLFSFVCGAIAYSLTGSGYKVKPGRPFSQMQ